MVDLTKMQSAILMPNQSAKDLEERQQLLILAIAERLEAANELTARVLARWEAADRGQGRIVSAWERMATAVERRSALEGPNVEPEVSHALNAIAKLRAALVPFAAVDGNPLAVPPRPGWHRNAAGLNVPDEEGKP